ncbi:GAF domain-containing protein [Actinoplanes sp. NPDC049316]|uniref:GAF domain-containing protein n=1 Tax=Actinoplanes sp. NPDC049316 TaxID=3154727 RepID=UPI003419113D
MSDRSRRSVGVIDEVAAIAAMPRPLPERAGALLTVLQQVIHSDAAYLVLLDPERRVVPALARRGYPGRVQEYLDGPAMIDDLEQVGMLGRKPRRVCDSPVPPEQVPVWAEYLRPAGFGEGVGVPLHTFDGRYLGVFAASTETTVPLDEDTCHLLERLAPLIADAVDPLRALTELAALVTDAVAGVVLTREGGIEPLPGLPGHPELAPGSRALAEASARLGAAESHAVLLTTTTRCAGRRRDYLKVTVLACHGVPPGHRSGVVLLSPAPDLHTLTHRDLTVLGLLIAGWQPRRVAAHLGLSPGTVMTTLDHTRAALRAPTRDAAVLRAAALGLYLPAPIAPDRD